MSLIAPTAPPATRIAITSGKGGVGKTSLTINLAVAMARLGHRVGIFDADFALGNIDVLLGLTPEQNLSAVLDGSKHVDDVTIDGPSGVRIVPAGSGVRSLSALDQPRWARLSDAVADASRHLDFLLFDTATGISNNVLEVVRLADYALVVTSHDPAAVVDGYAMIKVITAVDRAKPIGVIVNATADADQGALVFRQISLATERFLGRSVRYDGHVVHDRSVTDAALAQVPLVSSDQSGPASRCIRRLACRLVASRPTGSGPWGAPRPAVAVPPALVGQPGGVASARVAPPHAQGLEAPRCA